MLLGLLAFLAVPALLMSSPAVAYAVGYAQKHTATVLDVQRVDQHRVLGFADGRLGRTECGGAEYRVSWPGGGGLVRHCWADIDVAGLGDRWLIDPVTGQVARSTFDGWLRPGDSIEVVQAPRGNPVPLWEVTAGGAGDDFVRIGVMLALGSIAWLAAVRLGRRPPRRRRRMAPPPPVEVVVAEDVNEVPEVVPVVDVVEPPVAEEPAEPVKPAKPAKPTKPRLRGESKDRAKAPVTAQVEPATAADVTDSQPQPKAKTTPKAKTAPKAAKKTKAESKPKAEAGAPAG